MTRLPRRNHSPAFKAKAALAAIRGEQTLVELSQQFERLHSHRSGAAEYNAYFELNQNAVPDAVDRYTMLFMEVCR